MLDSSEQVQQRRGALTPADTCQGMYIGAVLGMVTREFGAEAIDKLRVEREVPKTVVPFFRYPVSILLHVADGAAHLLVKHRLLTYEDALFAVGKSLIATYFDSPVGKTMVSLSGGNPHRILGVGPAAYQATYSFGTRSYTKVGEREGAFKYQGDYLGAVMSLGIIKSGMEIASSVKPVVTVEDCTSPTNFTLVVKW